MVVPVTVFQSLSRDSGRLNEIPILEIEMPPDVSIPQSGFGAFELPKPVNFLPGPGNCFNPSVGIRGV